MKGIADQSRTGVGEDRRNARSITHYYFTCEHNKSAKELKPDVYRMQCAESTANHVDSTKNLIQRIQYAEAWFGKAKCDEVLTQFSCRQLTQGERERAKKVAAFSKNLKSISFAVTSKAERPQAIEITCQMGGGISQCADGEEWNTSTHPCRAQRAWIEAQRAGEEVCHEGR